MKRIDGQNALVNGNGPGKNAWQDYNSASGQWGTIPNASTLNAWQEEWCGYIEAMGLTLNPADNTQLYQAISAHIATQFRGMFAAVPTVPPSMVVDLTAGFIPGAGTVTQVSAQSTAAFVAPVGNPRIDRIVINRATGALSVVTGVSAAAPVAPAVPAAAAPIAQVALSPATTAITAAMITDERDLPPLGLGSAAYLSASSTNPGGGLCTVYTYAGNPNGAVAGTAGVVGVSPPDKVWDTVDKCFWVCTTSGTAATAVWLSQASTTSAIALGTSTGTANAQVFTPTQAITALSATTLYLCTWGITNTGGMTVSVSGLGAVPVYKDSPSGPIALAGGECAAGNDGALRWDGTHLQLTSTDQGTASLLNASSTNAGAGVAAEYGYAGNPNANLAGVAAVAGASPADRCWDTVHKQWWICTTTGTAATAVWQVVGSMAPVTVASAAVVDLGAQASTNITITGAATIASLGASAPGGQIYTVMFGGAATLTYNAASLILPGKANIAASANDTAQFLSLGGGNWLCIDYQTASGLPLVPNQIQAVTASVAANALTVGLSPTTLSFRSSTLASGAATSQMIPTALALTVPTGATLGMLSGQQAELVLLVAYNAGSPVLCIANLAGGINFDETALISPTTISAAATSASTIYSAAAVAAGSPFRVVGCLTITGAAAGTWATAPTLVQGQGGQAMAAMQSLGVGQTYQGLTASRALSTTYYNPTPRPILVFVSVGLVSAPASATLFVNGIVAAYQESQSNQTMGMSAIVPAGGSYATTVSGTVTLNAWSELR